MTHEKLCWNILKISFNTPVSQYPSSMYLEIVGEREGLPIMCNCFLIIVQLTTIMY